MNRVGAAAFVTVFALSAPTAALAQSVGDEQYRDPFAGQDQPQSEESPQPAPAPAPAPAPTTSAPTESTAAEPIATVAGTLPRTGADAVWVALAGVLLTAAGAGLRRTART